MARTMLTIMSFEKSTHQIYWVDHRDDDLSSEQLRGLRNRIIDDVDQTLLVGLSPDFVAALGKLGYPAELVTMKPGVTDNPAKSFKELLAGDPALGHGDFDVHSGVLGPRGALDYNPFVNQKKIIQSERDLHDIAHLDFKVELVSETRVSEFDLGSMKDDALLALSQKNCWALSLPELKLIRSHFTAPAVKEERRIRGLPRNPTDVELELLAQTWSEHCKHKIFSSRIDYKDDERSIKVEGLFKDFIKGPTYALKKDWAISVFDDNAGVVRFRDGVDLCIKVETHNSPSALDPYGGALTGILGVNRDIMGTGLGAKPVANTNVFCVGMPDESELPPALLHPREILKGVHRGVMDGGNKSGIPTVNGAIHFHESYSGKPLVYCGTVGILPPSIQGQSAVHKGQRPGDLVVMVGGHVGIDGIHGATASSLVMDKTTTLGMVQIGDPFSQKRMLDFLLVARDRLLYNSITDNGAGGLASSVGEMASVTKGAVLNLETVPLKYPGLQPWQILVSESQERMTLSVAKEKWAELRELAALFQVDVTSVGEFTQDGYFTCTFGGRPVCRLELAFLHDGLPKMELTARYSPREYRGWKPQLRMKFEVTGTEKLLTELLSHPTIASKERWIRQYDHEVQGASVVKPFEGIGEAAPNDAGVLWYGAHGVEGKDGFAVASGLCPHFSIDDTYLMAKLAVDEAVRNLLCHGVDPEKIALVDNFCWPDPTPSEKNPDAEYKLGQLVRTCLGLKEMVETYGMPLVSGKDSMKNDYHGEKVKISVLPTLLVTALGHVPDVTTVPRSHAAPGTHLYRLGKKDYDRYFGHFLHECATLPRENRRDFDWGALRSFYQRIHRATAAGLVASLHDVAEGGFLVALFETLLLASGGIDLTVDAAFDETAYLFSELPGHFVVSVDGTKIELFEKSFDPSELEYLGPVNDSGAIRVGAETLSMKKLAASWRNV